MESICRFGSCCDLHDVDSIVFLGADVIAVVAFFQFPLLALLLADALQF
jgi:hypothetical protein